MQAWISGDVRGVEGLVIKERPRPVPEGRWMLVRVTHAAVNFSDILMISDRYQVRPERPFIPGQEISGIVVKAADECGFDSGDRISSKVVNGGFAEFVLVRADMALRVPDGRELTAAAALPVSYTTALVALDHCARLRKTDTVLVHAAAGGVGLAAVEIASLAGATVIAAAGSRDRLRIPKSRGASHCVNYRNSDWFRRVLALTDGRGAQVIVDPVGGRVGEESLRCIAVDGRFLIVGFASGRMPELAPHRLLLKRAAACGVYWNHDKDADLLTRTGTKLMDLFAKDKVRPRIDCRKGLTSLPGALADLAHRRVKGKLVLRVAEDTT
ncbi:MAG: NADPH:quinone oxidoreductase family protein [Paracoccaceae bacterium]|nr:NADPH:quinone oxidoreductase family protein [Paracoccaceae bacterium]